VDLEGLPEASGSKERADDDNEAGGGLIVELDEEQAGRRSSGAALVQQWFAQAAFQVQCSASCRRLHCHDNANPLERHRQDMVFRPIHRLFLTSSCCRSVNMDFLFIWLRAAQVSS
jgi:hypothetical protein